MEFVYSAFNNSQHPHLKGKISKWRHLQTISTQLLLVALVFFLILQNGNLRKQISTKLSLQIVEDIYNQKMVQLQKQIEQIKLFILESNKKNTMHAEEVKKLIRIMNKQIGLPLPKEYQENVINEPFSAEEVVRQQKRTKFSLKKETVKEKTQKKSEENELYGEDRSESEDEEEEENSQQLEGEEDQFQFTEPFNSKSIEKCTLQQHLQELFSSQVQTLEQEDQQANKSAQNESIHQKFGNHKDDIKLNYYVNQFKSVLMMGGHILLLLLVFLCLFILGSFIKNPKYRSKSGQTFDSILKVGSKNDSHSSYQIPHKHLIKP